MPAVPGTEVLNVRRSPEERAREQEILLEMLLPSVPRKAALAVLARYGFGELANPDAGTVRDANGRTPSDSDIRTAATDVSTVPYLERIQWVRNEVRRLHDVSFNGRG